MNRPFIATLTTDDASQYLVLCYSPLWLKRGENAPVRHVVARTVVSNNYVYPDSLLLYAVRSVRAQATLKGDLRLLPFVPNWWCIEMERVSGSSYEQNLKEKRREM